MPGDLEQVLDRVEPRLTCQLTRNVCSPDSLDRLDEDVAVIHRVAAADLDVGLLPDTDAASDATAPDALAEAFGEDHVAESLYGVAGLAGAAACRIARIALMSLLGRFAAASGVWPRLFVASSLAPR